MSMRGKVGLFRAEKAHTPKLLVVYIDGGCPLCTRAGHLILRLELLGLCQVTSYRKDPSFERFGLTFQALDREIHVVWQAGKKHEVVQGFDALVLLAKFLPPLWPFLPSLALLKLTGLGPKVYRWLADNRTLIPETGCKGGACTPKGTPFPPE